jgi:copper chaperone CopZ
MNNKIISTIIALTLLSSTQLFLSDTAFASGNEGKSHEKHSHINHDHKDSTVQTIAKEKGSLTIKVEGMVCAFCAQGIEKNFKEHKEVKNTKVTLENMQVKIEFHEGKSLSEKKIKETIKNAGFKYVGVKENES